MIRPHDPEAFDAARGMRLHLALGAVAALVACAQPAPPTVNVPPPPSAVAAAGPATPKATPTCHYDPDSDAEDHCTPHERCVASCKLQFDHCMEHFSASGNGEELEGCQQLATSCPTECP